MAIRRTVLVAALAALALSTGCNEGARGPVVVSAIGDPPELVNPNLKPLDPPSELLIGAVAQGLVRFDAAGQVEPALAQSWIVSDDGLRYTFRIGRATWSNGSPVTADQVVRRLRAAIGGSSRNPLKPLLLSVDQIEAMTGNVLEISLKSPRPNFLQLLAQPELAIVRNNLGTGPFRATPQGDGSVLLSPPDQDDEAATEVNDVSRDIVLRGEPAALAVARFRRGLSHFVTGGTIGELLLARSAALRGNPLRFDPVGGLFGIAFTRNDGIVADPEVRRALAMAIDRAALATVFALPELLPRESLLPGGLDEVPAPALPDWAANPLPMRRALAASTIAQQTEDDPVTLRVAVPAEPGYRLVFAHLRRDWRAIGVVAEAVGPKAEADLRFVDAVAAANVASWYLRRLSCATSVVCSPEADSMLDAARTAPPPERQQLLANADRVLTDATVFIPLGAPVRWSLVSPRLIGFQPNPFGRRFLASLVPPRR